MWVKPHACCLTLLLAPLPPPPLHPHPLKVYLASASPPVRYPNVYGVDMPTRRCAVAGGKRVWDGRRQALRSAQHGGERAGSACLAAHAAACHQTQAPFIFTLPTRFLQPLCALAPIESPRACAARSQRDRMSLGFALSPCLWHPPRTPLPFCLQRICGARAQRGRDLQGAGCRRPHLPGGCALVVGLPSLELVSQGACW